MTDTPPVPGIHLLLGNDITGRIVVPNVIVSVKPLSFDPIHEMMENLGLFPSCAMTRSKTNATIHPQTVKENLASEGSMYMSCLFDESVSPSEL